MPEPLRCYRHPERETLVSCAECGRGICPDCMTFGPVGIRCPEHASAGGRPAAPRRAARRAAGALAHRGPLVTQVLIALSVGIYLLQLATGAGLSADRGWIFEHGVLVARAIDSSGQLVGVAEGEWWRLLTAAFLHGGPVHLALNMVVLWFIGPALEEYLGHVRYALLYLASGLAGSAGALVASPDALTVGASGAIWGLMAAAAVFEARRIYVFGGQAMGLIVLNVVFTLVLTTSGAPISLGGHIGGGLGGASAALALMGLRGAPTLAALAVAGLGALSVAVALARVA